MAPCGIEGNQVLIAVAVQFQFQRGGTQRLADQPVVQQPLDAAIGTECLDAHRDRAAAVARSAQHAAIVDPGDAQAGALLQAWLDVYSERYLLAKNQRPVDPDSAAHRQLAAAQA